MQYGRLMSSRLLTDGSMVSWDNASTSTSRGETPSFSCSRAVMAADPDHSSAGNVTAVGEDWSAAWREVERMYYKCLSFPLNDTSLPRYEEPTSRFWKALSSLFPYTPPNTVKSSLLNLKRKKIIHLAELSRNRRRKKLHWNVEMQFRIKPKNFYKGNMRGEVRQALSLSHQNERNESYATAQQRCIWLNIAQL